LRTSWSESDLRRFLNGVFYDKFSGWEKALIAETIIINKVVPTYNIQSLAAYTAEVNRIKENPSYSYGVKNGTNTSDKIFLLSIDEVVKYFGGSGRIEEGDFYSIVIDDQFNKNRMAYTDEGVANDWWLRSPGSGSLLPGRFVVPCITCVLDDGRIEVTGNMISKECGVRPALWLNLEFILSDPKTPQVGNSIY